MCGGPRRARRRARAADRLPASGFRSCKVREAGSGRFARMTPAPQRRGLDRRMILGLLALVVIAAGLALLLQSGGHNSQPLAAGTHSASSTSFLGDELSPPKAAP